MKVAIIGGFLGSGKTTTIRSLGTRLAQQGHKVAIVVNEIGEIDIDGEILKKYGLETKEIIGGCICCNLKVNLLLTLKELRINYDPSFILIEPTGLAYPDQIKNDIIGVNMVQTSIMPTIILIDPTNFDEVLKLIEHNPRAKHRIDGDILCINKTDKMSRKGLSELKSSLHGLYPESKIMSISAKEEEGIDKLINILYNGGKMQRTLADLRDSVEFSGISSYSSQYDLLIHNGNKYDWRKISENIFSNLRDRIANNDPEFIGHIKMIVKNGSESYKCNLTSLDEDPKIELLGIDHMKPTLKILCAVKGLEERVIEKIVDEEIITNFAQKNIFAHKLEHYH